MQDESDSTIEPSTSTRKKVFDISDRCEVRYRGGSKWLRGEVINVRKNGTYDVKYDNGSKEVSIGANLIREEAVDEMELKT